MANKPKSPDIKDLYPNLSPEELEEVRENRRRYIELVWRMYNRLKREGKLGEVMQELRRLQDKEE